MSDTAAAVAESHLSVSRAGRHGLFGFLHDLEDLALVLVLALMVALPVLEIALRGTIRVGIANAAAIVQHLVLVVGMVGAMVAARENRLLALSSLHKLLPAAGLPDRARRNAPSRHPPRT